MDVRLQTRYLTKTEVEAHAEDPQFKVREPGLVVMVLIPKKERTKTIPLFIPESDLRRMMEGR